MSNHQHSLMFGYEPTTDIYQPIITTTDGKIMTSNSKLTDGTQVTQLKLNTNHTGSGSVHYATCDFLGRTAVSSDCGIPINALTSTNAQQSLRCEDGQLKVKTSPNKTTLSISESLSQNEDSDTINTEGYTKMRIWGTTSTTDTLLLEYSNQSSGGMLRVDTLVPTVIGSTNAINKHVENPPAYFRISNINATSTTLDLKIELSN